MSQNLFLVNYMEKVVWQMLDDVLDKDSDVCKCDKCRFDIAALALNELSPHYVVSEKGEVFSKVNMLINQYQTDVVAAITKAIMKVKAQPKHNI